jgi:hypothetical protein
MNTTTQLHTAIADRETKRAKLDSATAALARAREAAAECQREADRLAGEEARWLERHSRKLSEWISGGGHGNRPQAMADVKAAAAQMTARANLAAAESARGQFEVAEREAREALAAAEADVMAAAREALHGEVRAEFECFRRQAAEFAATREWLFAAYLGAGRVALKPAEWLELDSLLGCTSDLMGVGSAWLDIPINELEQTGARDRPKEARRRIDALIPEFRARLEELASGGGEPAAEPLEEEVA